MMLTKQEDVFAICSICDRITRADFITTKVLDGQKQCYCCLYPDKYKRLSAIEELVLGLTFGKKEAFTND